MLRVLKITLPAICFIGSLGMGAGGANASALYQSVPDLYAAPTHLYCSTCNAAYNQRQYDTFSLATGGTITSVTFNIENDSILSIPASLQIGFFQVAGAMPGSPVGSFTVTPAMFSSQVDTGFGERKVSTVTVPISLMLAAGTFDISFYSASGLGVAAYSGGSGLLAQTQPFYPGPTFLTHPGESLGFELDGAAVSATPLPAALPLFASGLGALGLFGWRRKRKAVATLAA